MLKKIMAIILSGLLIFGFMGVVAVAEAPLNLYFDFEDESSVDLTVPEGGTTTASGWLHSKAFNINVPSYDKGESVVRHTDMTGAPAEFGSACLEFVDQQDRGNVVGRCINYPVTLKPNTTYTLSAWVYAQEGVQFGISWWGTSAWADFIAGRDLWNSTYFNKWHRHHVTFTTDDTIESQMYIVLRQGTTGKRVLFDEVRLCEETNYVAPTEAVTARSINGDFEDITTRDTSSTNTTQVLAPRDWTVGSSLKNGTDTDAYAVVTNEKARSGNYSLKIRSNKNNAGYRVYRQVTNLEVGALYMLSFWTCVEQNVVYTYAAGANVYATRSWDHDGSEGNALNAQAFEKMKTKTDGEWVLSRSYFVPGGSTICLSIVCGDNSPFTAYFDDITLEKVSSIDLKAVDSAGKKITKLDTTKENKVKVYLSGANKDNVISSHKVIYAIYNKNGEITEVSALSLKDIVNTAATISTTGQSTSVGYLRDKLEFTIPAGSTAKVFAFSDLSTLIPTTVLELS